MPKTPILGLNINGPVAYGDSTSALSRPLGLEPGAVAVPGFVSWVHRIAGFAATRNLPVWAGVVQASPQIFGDPLTPTDPRVANGTRFSSGALQFEFWSLTEVFAGQEVTFDIAPGSYDNYASNVQAAETEEQILQAAIHLRDRHQLAELSARLRQLLESL